MTEMQTPIPHLSWPARLELKLAPTARGNRLVHNRHEGPLYIQKPFYPEGPECAHLYLLHPPGGIVSGDELTIKIDQQSGGHALVTTPGASRVYRARRDHSEQAQHVTLNVATDASIEWLPMETLIYPDSYSRLTQQIQLQQGAKYFGWEVVCVGLPECQQPFEQGRYEQQLQIFVDNRLKFHDRLVIEGSNETNSLMQHPIGLAGYSIHGLLVATLSEQSKAQLNALRELAKPYIHERAHVGFTQINDILIVRYLGDHSEPCRKLFTQIWQALRPQLIDRPACPPRIWRT